MPSFDIVCEVDKQEVDNAVNQAAKEIGNRFDFRGGSSSIDYHSAEDEIAIVADDDFKLRSIHQILEMKMVKRGLDLRCLDYSEPSCGSKGLLKQKVKLKQGLSKEESKKISKVIREAKLKVQSQIQDDQIRITGKKIDDLQTAIATVKQAELDVPLQFINMRS